MIVSLGQGSPGVSYSHRMPFRRPGNAGFYTPGLPPTAFYSHINAFPQAALPISAFRPNLPSMPGFIRPGFVAAQGGGPNVNMPVGPPPAQMDETAPPQQIRGAFGFTPRIPGPRRGWMHPLRGFGADAPVASGTQPAAPPQAIANMMSRTHRASPYGSKNVFPFRTMRTGVLPQIMSTAGGIRSGVANAAGMVNRARWGTFSNRAEIPGTVDPTRAY